MLNIKKVIAVGCLFLAGCAPALQRKAIVFDNLPGHDKDYDVFLCEKFAEESTIRDPSVGQGAVEGAVGGAVIGSLLGLLVGGAIGLPLGPAAGYGAGFGALGGSTTGAAANADELERRKKAAVIVCLQGKGYQHVAY